MRIPGLKASVTLVAEAGAALLVDADSGERLPLSGDEARWLRAWDGVPDVAHGAALAQRHQLGLDAAGVRALLERLRRAGALAPDAPAEPTVPLGKPLGAARPAPRSSRPDFLNADDSWGAGVPMARLPDAPAPSLGDLAPPLPEAPTPGTLGSATDLPTVRERSLSGAKGPLDFAPATGADLDSRSRPGRSSSAPAGVRVRSASASTPMSSPEFSPDDDIDKSDAAVQFFSGEHPVPADEQLEAEPVTIAARSKKPGGAGKWVALVLVFVVLGGAGVALLRPVPWTASAACTVTAEVLGTATMPREGSIVTWSVKDGDVVKAGDTLATLDTDAAKAHVATLEADRARVAKWADPKKGPALQKQVTAAKAKVAKAKKELDAAEAQKAKLEKNAKKNAKALATLQKGLPAKKSAAEKAKAELDALGTPLSKAEASSKLKALDAELTDAKAALEKNALTAPAAGTFVRASAATGTLAAGAEVGRVVASTATVSSKGPFPEGAKLVAATVALGGKPLPVTGAVVTKGGGLEGKVDLGAAKAPASATVTLDLGTRPFFKSL